MTSPVQRRPWQVRLPFFYGWIIVAIGFIASASGVGLTWAAGLLSVLMGAELGWSHSAIFFAISMRGWVGIIVTPMIGSYLDQRNGPRILALTGGALNSLSLLFMPWMDSQWQFLLLFGVIGGVAQAAQSGISAATVPKWFVRRRGSAVSFSTMGGGVAAIMLPPFVGLLAGAAGWRTAWLVMGILAFVIGTIPALLLSRQPEDLGMRPDGAQEAVVTNDRLSPRPAWEEPSFTLDQALRSNAFWVLTVGIAIGSLANNGIPANLAPIFVDYGYTFEAAALSLIWYGIASTGTKVLFGWLTNRFPLRRVLLFLTLFGTFALSSILVFPSYVGPMAYGLLSGLYIGAFFPLSQMVWADYFGRAHVGAISALGRPLGLMLGASGPFLLAFTRDLTGSYDLGIFLNAASAALCFLSLFLVRPVRATAATRVPG